MTNEQAIKVINGHIEDSCICYGTPTGQALRMAIEALKAQLSQEGTTKGTTTDTISREDALLCLTGIISDMAIKDYIVMVSKRIRNLPPAQPEAPCYLGSPCEYQNPNVEIQEERTEKRTETHACVLISQQAAVELAMKYCPDDDGAVQCDGDIRELLDELENLPSAQPEEAIPVAWIEARIKRFMTMDNAFGGLTANIMLVMLNEWKREQEGETE